MRTHCKDSMRNKHNSRRTKGKHGDIDIGTKGKNVRTLISTSLKYKVDEVPPTAPWQQRINDLAFKMCLIDSVYRDD